MIAEYISQQGERGEEKRYENPKRAPLYKKADWIRRLLPSVNAKDGGKERQIQRPFHSDAQFLRSYTPSEMNA